MQPPVIVIPGITASLLRDEYAVTPDAVWMSDGGGVVAASPRPLIGIDRVVRIVLGLQRLHAKRGLTLESAEVNGEPGLVLRSDGRIGATYAIDVVDGRIGAVYVMLNPAKLPAA